MAKAIVKRRANGLAEMLPGGCRMTANSLELPEDLAYEDWLAIGQLLGQIESGQQWWIGDWQANNEYGETKANVESAGVTYGTAREYGRVSRAYELSMRIDNLSFNHRRIIAAIEEPRRSKLLQEALKQSWSAARLKSEARPRIPASPEALTAICCKAEATDFLHAMSPADLLLTDPPYMTDVDDIGAFAQSWLPLALAKVKPTGRAYVFIGAYPEELAAYLTAAMPRQILVWSYQNTLGPKPKQQYILNWQAVLYYEGAEAPPLNSPLLTEQFAAQEISAPDGRQGNRFFKWQKPDELAERFVRHATAPGDTVVDPFCGSGTFLLAAAKLGRHAIGCDIDEEALKIAEERGCERQLAS